MQSFLHCVCPPGMSFSTTEQGGGGGGEEEEKEGKKKKEVGNPIRGYHLRMGCHNTKIFCRPNPCQPVQYMGLISF